MDIVTGGDQVQVPMRTKLCSYKKTNTYKSKIANNNNIFGNNVDCHSILCELIHKTFSRLLFPSFFSFYILSCFLFYYVILCINL